MSVSNGQVGQVNGSVLTVTNSKTEILPPPEVVVRKAEDGSFVDGRGLGVLTATRGNILLMAGYFYGLNVRCTEEFWADVDDVILVHPDLMSGPTGSVIKHEGVVYCIMRGNAPPAAESARAHVHPTTVLTNMSLRPLFMINAQTPNGPFDCTVSVMSGSYSASASGATKGEAKAAAARTLISGLPDQRALLRLRICSKVDVMREMDHVFGELLDSGLI